MTDTNVPSLYAQSAPLGAPVTPSPLPDFSAALEERRKEWKAQSDEMLTTFELAAQQDPETFRRQRALAQQFQGIPFGTLQKMPEFVDRFAREEAMRMAAENRQNPMLAAAMSSFNFAAAASDDLPILEATEGLFSWLGRNWEAGSVQNERGFIGARMAMGVETPEDMAQLKVIDQILRRAPKNSSFFGFIGDTTLLLGQMLPTMAKSAGAGAVTAAPFLMLGPAAPIGVGAAFETGFTAAQAAQSALIEGGSAYLEYVQAGYSPEAARAAAFGVGILNGALETAGMHFAGATTRKLFGKLVAKEAAAALAKPTATAMWRGVLGDYLKGIAGEVTTEGLQELVTIAGNDLARSYSRPELDSMVSTEWGRQQIADRVFGVMGQTLRGMILVGLPGAVGQFAVDAKRLSDTHYEEQMTQQLETGVSASKLREGAPDLFRQFMDDASGPAPTLYFDAKSLRDLVDKLESQREASGATTESVRDTLRKVLPDVAAQLDEAARVGDDVTIPTSTFTEKLVGTDLGRGMYRILRAKEDSLSQEDRDRYGPMIQAYTDQTKKLTAEKIADRKAWDASAKKVFDDYNEQLAKTGRYSKAEARTEATLTKLMVQTLAARTNRDPFEVWQQYRPTIVDSTQIDLKTLPADALKQLAGKLAQTGDHANLQLAQEMVAKGVPMNDVRQATGWFQSPGDLQWRFEISDDAAKLKSINTQGSIVQLPQAALDQINAKRKANGLVDLKPHEPFLHHLVDSHDSRGVNPRVPLHEVLDHPLLFAAYPQLRDVKVELYHGHPLDGGYTNLNQLAAALLASGKKFVPGEPRGEPASFGVNMYRSPTVVLGTLLHEIQHGIQDIEGFAAGGGPSMFSSSRLDYIQRLQQEREGATRAADAKRYPGFAKVFNDYMAKRAVLETAVAALQNMLVKAGGVFNANSPEAMAVDAARHNAYRAWDAVTNHRFGTALKKIKFLTAFEAYQSLYGEAEARNTDDRRNMTEAERKAHGPFPFESALARDGQVVGLKDAIVSFPGDNLQLSLVHPGMFRSVDDGVLRQALDATEYRQPLSSRVPTGVATASNALFDLLTIDYGLSLAAEEAVAKNATVVSQYEGFRAPAGAKPAEVIEAFVEHMRKNLVWLHDSMTPEMRARAKEWYVGGRKVIDVWSERYGLSAMQIAGGLAVLSPQNQWFMNMSQFERIADQTLAMRNEKWNDAQNAWADEMVARAQAAEATAVKKLEVLRKHEASVLARIQPQIDREVVKKTDALRQARDASIEAAASVKNEKKRAEKIASANRIYDARVATATRVITEEITKAKLKSTAFPAGYSDYASDTELESGRIDVRKAIGLTERVIESRRNDVVMLNAARGKTLGELLATPEVAARWIRSRDETSEGGRAFRVMTPEGGTGDWSTNKDNGDEDAKGADDARATMMWKSYSTISKAVSIILDGSVDNIHRQLGTEHKVRNFYNNLFGPESPLFCTIDTHAVAAALLRPLSATSIEVNHAFGGKGVSSIGAGETGLNGTYAYIFEAYRRAAADRGLLPREMQSITWEALRALFSPEQKRDKALLKDISAVWAAFKDGTATIEETRAMVLARAGQPVAQKASNRVDGFVPPSWLKYAPDAKLGRTYDGEASRAADAYLASQQAKLPAGENNRVMSIGFEAAPNPDNPVLVAQWEKLTLEQKVEATRRIATEAVAAVLHEYGIEGKVHETTGGFEGKTNPTMVLEIEETQLAWQIAQTLGKMLRQKQTIVASAVPGPGLDALPAVQIELPASYTVRQIDALHQLLRTIVDAKDAPLVGGFTVDNGVMSILDFSGLPPGGLAAHVSTVLTGHVDRFTIHEDTVYSALLDTVETKPDANTQGTGSGTAAPGSPGAADTPDQGAAPAQPAGAGSRLGRVQKRTSDTFDRTLRDLLGGTYRQVDGPGSVAFKRFFGHSVVVDRDGNPLRVYRGVRSTETDPASLKRSPGSGLFGHGARATTSWSDDPSVAGLYSARVDSATKHMSHQNEAATMAAYLRIENPVDLRGAGVTVTLYDVLRAAGDYEFTDDIDYTQPGKEEGAPWKTGDVLSLIKLLAQAKDFGPPFLNVGMDLEDAERKFLHAKTWDARENLLHEIEFDAFALADDADIVQRFQARGFDGIIHDDTTEASAKRGRAETVPTPPTEHATFRPFDNNQIKVVSNRGTWNRNDPNVLNQPGSRGTYSPSQRRIVLNPEANRSTGLHELAHWFLDTFSDLAQTEAADEGMRADWDGLLDWFGITADEWNQLGGEGRRRYHEQFAYNFEGYLFENKPPEPRLQPLFQRFMEWLKAVYKEGIWATLQKNYKQDTGVDLPPLTDDVRAIMGRMIAGEQAADVAIRTQAAVPLFQTEAEFTKAGGDPKAWAELQAAREAADAETRASLQRASVRAASWTRRAMEHRSRELRAERDAMRAELRPEVTEEVQSAPLYRLIRWLSAGGKRGENKLDLAATMDAVQGDDRHDVLTKLEPYTSEKGGLAPDVVAQQYEFADGAAMLRALADAPPVKDAIETRLDQRMVEEHSELADPKKLQAAVEKAVHNQARERFVAAELRALMKSEEPVRVMRAAARAAAITAIAQKRVRDIQPGMMAAAAQRAARSAFMFLKEGKHDEAVAAKRRQLLQEQLSRVAAETRAEIDTALDDFRVASKPDAKLAKTHDMPLVNAARAILAAFGVGATQEQRQRLLDRSAEFMRQLQAYDPPRFEEIQQLMTTALAGAQDFKDLTVTDFRVLRDTVKAVLFQAKRRTKLHNGEVTASRDEVLAEMKAMIVARVGASTPAKRSAAVTALQGLRAAMTRAESLFDAMDGAKGPGVFTKWMFRPFQNAIDAYRVERTANVKKLLGLLSDLEKKGGLKSGKIAASEIGYVFGANNHGNGIAELLGALLHSGNKSNLAKLLIGREWTDLNAAFDDEGNLNTTQWDRMVARMEKDGIIRKEHWDFVQAVWDLNESLKPLAQRAHMALYGRFFDEVKAHTVRTKFGDYRGGYVPAKVDLDHPRNSQSRVFSGLEQLESDHRFAMPSTEQGFTMSRVENWHRPLDLDIRKLTRHIDSVIRFAHVQPVLRDITNLLRDQGLQDHFAAYDPSAIEGVIMPWLTRGARQVAELPGMNPTFDKFWRGVRQRTGMASMFANLSNALQQVTGWFPAALKVQPSYLMGALFRFLKHDKTISVAEIAKLSPYMAERLNHQMADLTHGINDLVVNPGAFTKLQQLASRQTYFLQSGMQNMVDIVTWSGAYEQATAAGVEQAEAVARADAAVRLTQGTTAPEGIARFEAGTPFLKIWTQFQGYFNMLANLQGAEFRKILQDLGWVGGSGKLFYTAMLGFVVPSLIADAIAKSFTGDWDDEDDDGYSDEFASWLFGGIGRGLFAMVPFGGNALAAFANSFNDKPYDDRLATSPSISALESATIGVERAGMRVAGGDDLTGKNLRDVLTLATLLTGLPFSAAGRPVGYLRDVARGQVRPYNTGDEIRGAITGRAAEGTRQR